MMAMMALRVNRRWFGLWLSRLHLVLLVALDVLNWCEYCFVFMSDIWVLVLDVSNHGATTVNRVVPGGVRLDTRWV